MSERDRVRDALKLLLEEIEERAARDPWGHLLEGRGEFVSLHLELPFRVSNEDVERATENARRALEQSFRGVLAHRAVLKPGRVFSLRDGNADDSACAPSSPREVFAGYSPTGVPRFLDFAQWLQELGDPEFAALFGNSRQLVTRVSNEDELTKELLPAFRDRQLGFRVHGQVSAGWYRIPDDSGRDETLALTFQIVSSQWRRRRRRFGLNVLGIGPGGESLTHLYDRLGALPWAPAVRWAQSALESLPANKRRRRARSEQGEPRQLRSAPLPVRIDGILTGLARRLERGQRSRGRRTKHAEARHEQGSRPTRMALTDLANASREELFFDARRKTIIVLGDRGRTHVFSPDGKLVTSVRYPTSAIEKKLKVGIWTPADDAQVAVLRTAVAGKTAS